MRVVVFLRIVWAVLLLAWVLILPCSSENGDNALSAEQAVYRALSECRDGVDISEFKVHKSDAAKLLKNVLYDSPELFYVGERFSYSYNSEGIVLCITPSYKATGDALAQQRAFYYDTANLLMRDCPANATQAETVLYIHDTLASKYDYDTEYASYDAYSLFKDGRGVCQAYSLAFVALCRTRGIDAHMTVSDEMDHAWNTVRVDGTYYHVDVTRDDPISDTNSSKTVLHSAFLRSDAGMEDMGYHGYAANFSCDSSRFEAGGVGVLEGVSESVIFRGNGIFGFDGERLFKITLGTPPSLSPLPTGDTNGDGAVDVRDLLALKIGTNLPHTVTDEKKLSLIILQAIAKTHLYE